MTRISNIESQISNIESQTSNRPTRRPGFTLVELLVVITVIALLAAMSMGALAKARESGKAAATKTTVVKLHDLVMRKYESYLTRRLPLDVSSLQLGAYAYSWLRMCAIRDLMRMEMPERWIDITQKPVSITLPAPFSSITLSLPSPSLQQLYLSKYNAQKPAANADHQQAKCLYLWVMTSIPEAKSTFTGSEIADVDGDGWKCFVDGWGNPIGFLRWAPGATVTQTSTGAVAAGTSGWSDVQIDDTAGNDLHHDPFDPNRVESNAYHLYPLIFAGVLSKVSGSSGGTFDDYGIALGNGQVPGDCNVASIPAGTSTSPSPDPFSSPYVTSSGTVGAILPNGGVPLVHNHHIEMR